MSLRARKLFFLCLSIPSISGLCAAQVRYRVVDIGGLGSAGAMGLSINDRGDVVGTSFEADGALHAFFWESGTMWDLASSGIAFGINNRSQVVGTSFSVGAFLWERGAMQGLGNFSPSAINERGQIVGSAQNFEHVDVPVIWQKGTLQALSGLPPLNSRATAINDSGDIVACGGAIWIAGQFQELGLFGSAVQVCPLALNNRAQVVGNAFMPDNSQLGFLWQAGNFAALRPLAGDYMTSVHAINERGQIAGASENALGIRPVIWEDGFPIDLDALVPSEFRPLSGEAMGINNRGQIIIFQGSKINGRTLLLTPQ